ncbi:MAG: PEP-CTERM sorting domain-containing protein, partial [Phycisphaerae bacterium]
LLGDTPARSNVSAAYAVNGDGSVVVGRSNSIHDSEPMRWSETGGMIGLGRIPGAAYGGVALAVSSDGSVVVGQANGIAGGEAFRWTAATGMIGLGDLPGGIFRSGALGISGDGSLIVGQASIDSSIGIPGGITTAMIWDAQHGMRQLEAALVQDYGLALPGWWLYAATAVSQDGSAIVGWGKNPQGNQEAFLVLLPEPASAGLLALAMVLFPRRRVG